MARGVLDGLVPVGPDEIVKPTRVTWVHKNTTRISRVFPTEERARVYAETKPGAQIMDVSEPVPPQTMTYNKFRRSFRAMEKR